MVFPSRLTAGQILGGRYRIAGLIGSGGMSHVYLAEDLRLKGKCWAVKECLQQERGGGCGDIQAEAELLLSLRHRLLPGVADFFAPDEAGYSYLVMDYIEGVSLGQYMVGYRVPLEEERITGYAKQLLEVLDYLHGRHPPVIYRDLKPGNIMLTGPQELMLIDFGIAKSYRSGAGEDTEKFGTAGFAAPEQYGGGQSGPVSDLYGLGALMLYMATGGQYSQWQPGMENLLRGRVADALIPVIRRLLRHHPEERYQTAADVKAALEAVEAIGSRQVLRNKRSFLPAAGGTIVIALLGTASGLGTTHTSLAVSQVLALAGSTSWVEFNPESRVYGRLRNLLEASPFSEFSPFHWRGIDFRKKSPQENIQDMLQSSPYAYTVLDLGCGSDPETLRVFTDSDVPVLVSSGADWRLEDTLHWLQHSGLEPQERWRIGLPFAKDSAAVLLESGLGLGTGQVFSLPFQQDPFQRKGKLAGVIEELLSSSLGIRGPEKRRRLFQK